MRPSFATILRGPVLRYCGGVPRERFGRRNATRPRCDGSWATSRRAAGWIALRFLSDPTMAFAHFQHVDDGSTNPVVLARAGYWRGRAAEATGRVEEAHANYTAAARISRRIMVSWRAPVSG